MCRTTFNLMIHHSEFELCSGCGIPSSCLQAMIPVFNAVVGYLIICPNVLKLQLCIRPRDVY